MIRLYVTETLSTGHPLSLPESQSHYLTKVMRLGVGDEVLLFNGRDGEWKAHIQEIQKKSAVLHLTTQTRSQTSEGDLWLLFSPLKPKRQEFLVEKATELGATCLWPMRCQHTSSPLKEDKMKAHAIEAAEQSKRLTVPFIKPLTSLTTLLQEWPQDRVLLFGDETLTAPPLHSLSLDPHQPYGFLVGPEGGFSPQELDLLRTHAQGVTLSPHILRTETAALVGLTGIAMLQESFPKT